MVKLHLLFAALLVAVVCQACGQSRVERKIQPPQEAFDRAEIAAAGQQGVAFKVRAEPFSRKYFSEIEAQLVRLGFSPCKKSALTTWTDLPTKGESRQWMVEMLSTNGDRQFAVIRAEQGEIENGQVVQAFSVSFQDVKSPNLENIREFCG